MKLLIKPSLVIAAVLCLSCTMRHFDLKSDSVKDLMKLPAPARIQCEYLLGYNRISNLYSIIRNGMHISDNFIFVIKNYKGDFYGAICVARHNSSYVCAYIPIISPEESCQSIVVELFAQSAGRAFKLAADMCSNSDELNIYRNNEYYDFCLIAQIDGKRYFKYYNKWADRSEYGALYYEMINIVGKSNYYNKYIEYPIEW